jgi:hypothetical protein
MISMIDPIRFTVLVRLSILGTAIGQRPFGE